MSNRIHEIVTFCELVKGAVAHAPDADAKPALEALLARYEPEIPEDDGPSPDGLQTT